MYIYQLHNWLSFVFTFINAFWVYRYGEVHTSFQWSVYLIVTFLLFRICLFLIGWISFALLSLTIKLDKEYEKPSKFYNWVFYQGYAAACALARIHVHASGLEQIPKNSRFMLVSNHLSKFDNMIQGALLKGNIIAYVSKEENFKIPMGRHFLVRGCYLALDRGNVKSAMETIEKATELVKEGTVSIGVFPEGTRSLTGELGEFRPGCFRIALKSGCPIVLCAMRGTEKIHKRWPWRWTDVYCDVLKVFSAEELVGKKTVEVSDCAYSLLSDFLNA